MSTPFLWDTGTGNNGLLESAVTLLGNTSELASLANGSAVTSSVSGASGVFNNSLTGAAIWGEIAITLGAIGSALSANATLSGWFLRSRDGGSTFDATPPVKPPDFIIPLPATTISAATDWPAWALTLLPSVPFMVYLVNNSGQALAASGNTLVVGPVAPVH